MADEDRLLPSDDGPEVHEYRERTPGRLGADIRQAISDPGSFTVRRGLDRAGHQIAELEPVSTWQAGALRYVLRDYLDEIEDRLPRPGVDRADAFLDGWNAAVAHVRGVLGEAL